MGDIKQKHSLKDETLTIFLSSECSKHLGEIEQAKCIRRCAKIIHKRVTDKPFRVALRALRNTKNSSMVVRALNNAIEDYRRNKDGKQRV